MHYLHVLVATMSKKYNEAKIELQKFTIQRNLSALYVHANKDGLQLIQFPKLWSVACRFLSRNVSLDSFYMVLVSSTTNLSCKQISNPLVSIYQFICCSRGVWQQQWFWMPKVADQTFACCTWSLPRPFVTALLMNHC